MLLIVAGAISGAEVHDFKIVEIQSPMLFGLAFSPDGSKVVTTGDSIRVFDIHAGKLIQTITTVNLTDAATFLPNEPDAFVVSGREGCVLHCRIGEVRTTEWHSYPSMSINHVKLMPGGKQLIAIGKKYLANQKVDSEILLFDLEEGALTRSVPMPSVQAGGFDVTDDGRQLAVTLYGKDRHAIDIYDTETWEVEQTIPFGYVFPSGVAYLPNQEQLFATGGRPVVISDTASRVEGRVWKVFPDHEESLLQYEITMNDDVYRPPVLSPDQQTFVTATSQVRTFPNRQALISQIQCRSTKTGNVIWKQDGGIGFAYGVTFSPDGNTVAACSDGELLLFHAKTGHRILELSAAASFNNQRQDAAAEEVAR